MNEIKKCSISGIAFQFEPDAYEELSHYLKELREQYHENPDGEEIIADIEARIAELILSTQDNGRTVALPLVKNIIAQLGSAAEIEQESSSAEEKPRTQKPQEPRIPRRLYRSAEGAKLGGVCAGLGSYFDIDPVWVRLIFVLPILGKILLSGAWAPYWLGSTLGNIFWVFLIGYLIMWFAVPTARSARQKLEMKGEKITPEAIQQKTAEARHDVDGHSKAVVAGTVSAFGQVMTILLKLVAGLILMGLVLIACALIVGALAIVFTPELLSPSNLEMWTALLGILVVLVPCLLLIYVLMCLIASSRPNGKVVGFTFLGWVMIAFLLILVALRSGLHEEVIEELLPSPSYNSLNLMNDPLEAMEEAAEENVVKSGNAALKVSTPEGDIDVKVDEQGLKIDVKERVE